MSHERTPLQHDTRCAFLQGEMAMLGYSYSIMLCMSSALSTPNGRGLGTLGWHPQLAHRMLKDAGFSDVKTLEWESDLNSFYLAKP